MRSMYNWVIRNGMITVWCTHCGHMMTAPCSKKQAEALETECIQKVFPKMSADTRSMFMGDGKCGLCESLSYTFFSEEDEREMASKVTEILRDHGFLYRCADLEQCIDTLPILRDDETEEAFLAYNDIRDYLIECVRVAWEGEEGNDTPLESTEGA